MLFKPRKLINLIVLLLVTAAASPVFAAPEPIDTDKRSTLGLYLNAKEAYQMKQESAKEVLFIDVRTRAELTFLGMADSVDANIPYMIVGDWDEWDEKKHNFKLYPNSNFLPYFEEYNSTKGFNKQTKIILICRSGNRSSRAANLLAKVGYTQVYSVVDGFEGDKSSHKDHNHGHRTINGWKNEHLPWSYKLDESKMYMEF